MFFDVAKIAITIAHSCINKLETGLLHVHYNRINQRPLLKVFLLVIDQLLAFNPPFISTGGQIKTVGVIRLITLGLLHS